MSRDFHTHPRNIDSTSQPSDDSSTNKPSRATSEYTNEPPLTSSSSLSSATDNAMILQPEELTPTLTPSIPIATERNASKGKSRADDMSNTQRSGARKPKKSPTAMSGADLEKLKEAVNARQSAVHRSKSGSLRASSAGLKKHSSGSRTPLAAQLPPMTDAALGSPLTTGAQSTSTESAESVGTVKGSAAATPSHDKVRTPSYPFPYLSSRTSSGFVATHQPFTTLSPTEGATRPPGTRDRLNSIASTATSSTFVPSGLHHSEESEQSEYPTPSLYDLVLRLSSEPSLESWWNALSSLMHEWYKIERMTLALPADPTDLENVPWGQKATFNVAGFRSDDSLKQQRERRSSSESQASNQGSSRPRSRTDSQLPPVLDMHRSRPRIQTRHSYGDYEIAGVPDKHKASGPTSQPPAARRIMTNLPTISDLPSPSVPPDEIDNSHSSGRTSHSVNVDEYDDQDSASSSSNPCSALFPVLFALNAEADPLLDTAGVNRIVDRGKAITLTREYPNTTENTSQIQKNLVNIQTGQRAAAGSSHSPLGDAENSRIGSGPGSGPARQMFSKSKLSSALGEPSTRIPEYDEYEQFPPSPWAQSPAPSPAVPADPEVNPFFAKGNIDESSFNPTPQAEDYSQYGRVEAIGIDNAKTIIHIPLIHPVMSRTIQVTAPNRRKAGEGADPAVGQKSFEDPSGDTLVERKAPIAIVSVLAPIVPYPRNLVQSLKLLSLHMATTFHNSYQYTDISVQLSSSLHRRSRSGNLVGFEALPAMGLGLEGLTQLEMDQTSISVPGSIISPSEYSGHSQTSPGASVIGTPGWDSHSLGLSGMHSATETPAIMTGSEMIDSYFDSKKRRSLSRANSAAAMSFSQQAMSSSKTSPSSKKVSTPAVIDDPPTPKKDQKRFKSRERHTSGSTPRLEGSPTDQHDSSGMMKKAISPRIVEHSGRLDKRHSLLHSYGADFSASFQSLPVAAALRSAAGPEPRGQHTSAADHFYMAPPSERLLRTMMDALPVQIFIAAPGSGVLEWVNSKLLVYRGQSPQQVLENPFKSIHSDDVGSYQELWSQSLRTGHQFQQKVRFRRFDQQYRWYYVRALPLRDKRQNIVHWVGTCMDFHEQHIAELNASHQQETAASEAKYRALANLSPQIVFAATRNQGVTFCNTQWLDYSGQSEEQAAGLGFMEQVHPEDVAKCKLPTFDGESEKAINVPISLEPQSSLTRSSSSGDQSSENSGETSVTLTGVATSDNMQLPQKKLSNLAATGLLQTSKDADGKQAYSTEVRLRKKDGEYRWHLVRVLLADKILQEKDEETWYGSCTDINDHKVLEKTLKETMDAKSRFLSNMSHEIRTPLNGIHGMVNLLIDSNLTPEQMDQVNIIRASTEGLRDLINDILDLSKVEAGMITLNLDWIHIRSVIEEVNDLTSSLAMDKGIELNYLVEEDVPTLVKGDRFRIRQVLLNVIGNAIKFTSEGEVFVRCTVATVIKSESSVNTIMLQFDIMDTGRGFSETEAALLFKRFSQIDGSSTRQHGGTGLGLVISMQLVELHGGSMSASSIPGRGSTFTFLISCGLSNVADVPPPLRSSSAPAVPGVPSIPGSLIKNPSAGTVHSRSSMISSPNNDLVESPAMFSSGSSDPSIRTGQTSLRSTRSSASSQMHLFAPFDSEISPKPTNIKLTLPSREETSARAPTSPNSLRLQQSLASQPTSARGKLPSPPSDMQPPMFSILVVCPLKWTREATINHIGTTLPKMIPNQIAAVRDLSECQNLISGPESVVFTHIVLILKEAEATVALIREVFGLQSLTSTSVIVISDVKLKREVVRQAPEFDYDQLARERRLQFIFKPLKPSKIAVIFDPGKERELSTDQNQNSAQQIAIIQKQVFDEMTRRLGNKNHRVLLVEDNKVNQMVMLKLLKRVSIETDTVLDGVECTEAIFSQRPGYYSIILCDLHMPRKDGYQTCKDIRTWEKENNYRPVPVVALSANVLGDVSAQCALAGFNSYMTKPVEFKELCKVMTEFLDPNDPNKPLEYMGPQIDT